MNANVPLIEAGAAPLLARAFFDGDATSPLVRALAHVPELLETALPFIACVYGPTALSDRLKEIVVLRISARNGCRYCTRVHRELARAARLEPDEIAQLVDGRRAPETFDDAEVATFAFCDALCGEATSAASMLARNFQPYEIVELTLLGSATIMLNRFCTALDIV